MTVGEALQLLRGRRIRTPWLPGMRAIIDSNLAFRRTEDGFAGHGLGGDLMTEAAIGTAEPDLTDPATVGCLLALLREATGDPWAYTVQDNLDTGDGWRVMASRGWPPGWTRHRTEGEAIAAVLIALAGAP